jgi:hypothetical protein
MKDEHNACWCFRLPQMRNMQHQDGFRDFYFLSQELSAWLESHKVEPDDCILRYVPGGEWWVFSVPDDIAMLFKLTWSI